MTRRAADLEARLVDWARVYGGGRYDLSDGLKSPMGSMIKWGGRPPSGLGQEPPTPAADEVQDAVRALERQVQGWGPAQALQAEYLTPGKPVDSKIQALNRIGVQVSSRSQYSRLLRLAQVYVAAWCRLPFSAEVEDEETTAT